jgi:integration host factor subunit beta
MSEIKNIKTKASWNKSDLTVLLSNEAQIPKVRAATYINIITDTIAEALEKGKKVTISDFGTFQVSQRRSFKGRNPKTGDPLIVPVKRIPVFRAGKRLKTSLNIPKVKSCALVSVQKVKVVFSKVMDEDCKFLFDNETYDVLVDSKSVGPIKEIELLEKETSNRQGEEVQGVRSVVLTCSGSLRGKSLEVVFRKELIDIDGNYVDID